MSLGDGPLMMRPLLNSPTVAVAIRSSLKKRNHAGIPPPSPPTVRSVLGGTTRDEAPEKQFIDVLAAVGEPASADLLSILVNAGPHTTGLRWSPRNSSGRALFASTGSEKLRALRADIRWCKRLHIKD